MNSSLKRVADSSYENSVYKKQRTECSSPSIPINDLPQRAIYKIFKNFSLNELLGLESCSTSFRNTMSLFWKERKVEEKFDFSYSHNVILSSPDQEANLNRYDYLISKFIHKYLTGDTKKLEESAEYKRILEKFPILVRVVKNLSSYTDSDSQMTSLNISVLRQLASGGDLFLNGLIELRKNPNNNMYFILDFFKQAVENQVSYAALTAVDKLGMMEETWDLAVMALEQGDDRAVEFILEKFGIEDVVLEAESQAQLGRYNQADKLYAICLRYYGEDVSLELLENVANVKHHLKLNCEANNLYNKILEERQNPSESVLLCAAEVKFKLKLYTEAEAILIQLSHLSQDSSWQLQAALVRLGMKSYQDIGYFINQFLFSQPFPHRLELLQAAYCVEQTGDLRGSNNLFTRALTMYVNQREALADLRMLEEQLGPSSLGVLVCLDPSRTTLIQSQEIAPHSLSILNLLPEMINLIFQNLSLHEILLLESSSKNCQKQLSYIWKQLKVQDNLDISYTISSNESNPDRTDYLISRFIRFYFVKKSAHLDIEGPNLEEAQGLVCKYSGFFEKAPLLYQLINREIKLLTNYSLSDFSLNEMISFKAMVNSDSAKGGDFLLNGLISRGVKQFAEDKTVYNSFKLAIENQATFAGVVAVNISDVFEEKWELAMLAFEKGDSRGIDALVEKYGIKALYNEAKLKFDQKQYKEADKLFYICFRSFVDRFSDKLYQEADEFYAERLSSDKNPSLLALENQAILKLQLRQFNEAAGLYKKILEFGPISNETFANAAFLQYNLKSFPEANKLYNKFLSVERNPRGEHLIFAASIKVDLNLKEEANILCNRFLSLEEEHVELLLLKALVVKTKINLYDEANLICNKLLKHPNKLHSAIMKLIMDVKIRLNLFEEANCVCIILLSSEQNPSSGILETAARLKCKLRLYDEANALYDRYHLATPEVNPLKLLEAAYCKERIGDLNGAHQLLAQSLEILGDSQKIQEFLERLKKVFGPSSLQI